MVRPRGSHLQNKLLTRVTCSRDLPFVSGRIHMKSSMPIRASPMYSRNAPCGCGRGNEKRLKCLRVEGDPYERGKAFVGVKLGNSACQPGRPQDQPTSRRWNITETQSSLPQKDLARIFRHNAYSRVTCLLTKTWLTLERNIS